jgi:uncharacterized protein (DUF362 family)
MSDQPCKWDRRTFLRRGIGWGASVPLVLAIRDILAAVGANNPPPVAAPVRHSNAMVAMVSCRSYGPEVKTALRECFDLLGGIGSLVKDKTVTVKINLTGTNFLPLFNRPVGESYMTHPVTTWALGALLAEAGARRVRFVESNLSRARLETTLALADWDVNALRALGKVEFENTRNLGTGQRYAHLKVPTGGYLFSFFEFNHCYEETDVMVSLCKLKEHVTAGVTLSMKNLFGLTPNSLYGAQAGSEEAIEGRDPLHDPRPYSKIDLPGFKRGDASTDAGYRVPRIVADICSARPIHLAIIDGITAMSGGEGWWCGNDRRIRFTTPGVLIAGLNPVSTDAVGTAVMGFADPRASRGKAPFQHCDNHLLLAEQAGLGTADLAKIDVRGLTIERARYPYAKA